MEHFENDVDEIMSLMEEKEIRVRALMEEVDLLMEPDGEEEEHGKSTEN